MTWNQPGGSAAPLASFELVAGALTVRVYAHELGDPQRPIACWTYVTDGLARHAQDEMAFTLRRERGEPDAGFPRDPLALFAGIHDLAAQGRRVGPDGTTRLGDRKFFDHHVLYTRAQPLAGVALPARCLALLLVTDEELRAVSEFGSSRLLARMGQAARWYPFPPWNERGRQGLRFARTFEASVLSQVARAGGGEVYVRIADDRITLSLPRAAPPPWRDQLAGLAGAAPLAILTGIDPDANGCLVWVPGQTAPEAITPQGSDGSQICGCFVVLLGDQPVCGGKLLEDGAAMQLTAEAWQAVRRALAAGEDLVIPATAGGMPLVLRWRDDGASAAVAGADLEVRLTLVTAEADLAARTSSQELVQFCQAIRRCVARAVGEHPGELGLRMELRCAPGGHEVGLAHRGDAAAAMLQAVLDAVSALPPLAVRAGEVCFELEFARADRAPRGGS